MNFRRQQHKKSPEFVYVHADVIRESARLVQANPAVEVGGKLVGYRIRKGSAAPSTPYGKQIEAFWQRVAKTEALLLVGTIGSGPEAQATSTALLPDGRFQESVYRHLERAEPDIEHLGSWHSHHPNGMRQFSEGDVEGYAASISNPNYNEDVFIAGLCFEPTGLRTGVFDMYTRAAPGAPKRLDAGQIRQCQEIPSLHPVIADVERRLLSGPPPNKGPAGSGPAAVEQALLAAVGRGQIERIEVDGVPNWVVTWPRGIEGKAVVMYQDGRAALSITLRKGDVEMRLDAASPSRAAAELSREIADVVQSLTQALDSAERRAR